MANTVLTGKDTVTIAPPGKHGAEPRLIEAIKGSAKIQENRTPFAV